MGRIRIGLSGWEDKSWQGSFYPRSLARPDELPYAAQRLDTLEVNGTFYGLMSPRSFRRWYGAVPADFVFAVKGSRFITHNKKLADVDTALANFLASGVLDLDDKLGPILWQLSEHLHFDPGRIATFLALLPHDTDEAAALAHRHDRRVEDPSYGPGDNHRLRHVLEVRHQSFLCPEMVSLARRHGVCLAFSHSAEWPYVEELTAGFSYLRLHGPGQLYGSAYAPEELRRWAHRLRCWRDGEEPDDAVRLTDRASPARKERDVYVYLDNGPTAPEQAVALRSLVAEER